MKIKIEQRERESGRKRIERKSCEIHVYPFDTDWSHMRPDFDSARSAEHLSTHVDIVPVRQQCA